MAKKKESVKKTEPKKEAKKVEPKKENKKPVVKKVEKPNYQELVDNAHPSIKKALESEYKKKGLL